MAKKLKTLTLPNAQGEPVTYELHPEWDNIEGKPDFDDLGGGVGKEYIVNDVVKGEIFNNYEENIASGEKSHAEGYVTTASGDSAHSEGENTIAYGWASHAEGSLPAAIGGASHAEGNSSYAPFKEGDLELTATAEEVEARWDILSFAAAFGIASHSEGNSTLALGNGSHSEGGGTKATGSNSHAEGALSHSKGSNAHAEGSCTAAWGAASHSEGGADSPVPDTITNESTTEEIIAA